MKISNFRLKEIIREEINRISPGEKLISESLWLLWATQIAAEFKDSGTRNAYAQADSVHAASSFIYEGPPHNGKPTASGIREWNFRESGDKAVGALKTMLEIRSDMITPVHGETYDTPTRGDPHIPGVPSMWLVKGALTWNRMKQICSQRAKAYYQYGAGASASNLKWLGWDVETIEEVPRYSNPWSTDMTNDLAIVLDPIYGCEENQFTKSGFVCSGLIGWKTTQNQVFQINAESPSLPDHMLEGLAKEDIINMKKLSKKQLKKIIKDSINEAKMITAIPSPMKSRADPEFAKLIKGENNEYDDYINLDIATLHRLISEEIKKLS